MGRRLGQHFLYDPSILDRIVAALQPGTTDIVLEVGAGQGTLTRRLAGRVGRVVAIEKDPELVEGLLGADDWEMLQPNVVVVQGDALALDWHTLVEQNMGRDCLSPTSTFKVVGNIPYNVTAPLIEKALSPPMPSLIVYLIQREVADRLAAEPGSKAFGALTVGVKTVSTVDRLFAVKPGSFVPRPAVDSAVVRFTPLKQPLIAEAERADFRRFVGALFGQRRKQLSRALRTVTGAGKNDVEEKLKRLGIAPSVRPEVLTPAELLRLFRGMRGLLLESIDE